MKVDKQPISEELLANLGKIETSINGLMDRCPEAFKGTLQPIKDEFDSILGKMKPTDAALASRDVAWSLNDAISCFGRLQELMGMLVTQASSLQQSVDSRAATSLCEKVKDEVDAKITAGELVPKAVAEANVANALKAGRETALNEFKVQADRRAALALAKIPLPADESVLAGDDAAFNTLLETSTARLTSLNAKGVKDPATLSELLWSPTFDRDIKLLTSLNAFSGNPFKPVKGSEEKEGKENEGQPKRRPIV